MENKSEVENNYLVQFFIIAFGFTWLLQLPSVLIDNGLADLPAWMKTLSQIGTFGPMVAAFWLTNKISGKAGRKILWKRGWRFDFEKKWLSVVIFLPMLLAGLTILGVNLVGGEILWDKQPLPLFISPLIFVVIFFTQSLPEEYGWRGFALDRFQTRWNALQASLILGFLWGLWHLPLHYISGTTQEIMPIYQIILKIMLEAVLFTWVYNNTNRNIFLAILFHTVGNVLGGLIPFWVTNQGRWVNFGIELIAVIVIVGVYGAKTFVRESS